MKIHILQTDGSARPDSQQLKYPAHNADYGVEQDFLAYLHQNRQLTTEVPSEADWHYLPVYWTRWHLNHDYGKTGLSELQAEVDRAIIDDARTFTVCQYDDGPLVDTGAAVRFLSSRKGTEGIDIPLLCAAHGKPFWPRRKKYLASFAGRFDTHPLRQEMADTLKDRPDIFIHDGDRGPRFFVKLLLDSRVALCPRGYGGSSFRFFEAMQLGVVPLLLGASDTRPFRKFLPWDRFSLYSPTAADLERILASRNGAELQRMADRAREVYLAQLDFGKWCRFVLKELEDLG